MDNDTGTFYDIWAPQRICCISVTFYELDLYLGFRYYYYLAFLGLGHRIPYLGIYDRLI